MGARVVDVDHDILWVLKVTHHLCEAVVAGDEAVEDVLEVFGEDAIASVNLTLEAVDFETDTLLCHADGGGLVCDGANHVVHLVVDHDTIAEHHPVIHLDKECVYGIEVNTCKVRGKSVKGEAHLVPPAVLTLVMDDIDTLGVNLEVFAQTLVVFVHVVNPLVDVLLDKSLAEFGGHHVLDAAAGGVGVARVHATDGIDDEVVRGGAEISLHVCECFECRWQNCRGQS